MKLKYIACLSLLWATASFSAPTSVAGRGKAEYTNPIGKPSKEVEDQARKEAIYDAIDRALENEGSALREQYKKFGKSVPAEEYESKGIITAQGKGLSTTDPKRRVVTFQYSGSLDIQALRDFLNGMSSKEGGTDVALSKISCALLFTARVTSENFSFDAKRVVGTKREDSVEVEGKGVSANGGGVEAVEAGARKVTKSTASVESGTSERADKQKFELDSVSRDAFGTSLSEILTAKGFKKVRQGGELDVSTAIDEQYGAGRSLAPATLRQVNKEIKERWPTVQYYVYGTIDYTIPAKDDVTGLWSVQGRVLAKVCAFDEDGEVDSLANINLAKQGFGKSQQEAKGMCTKLVAEESANDLITKLRNKKAL
jgi:hypothetical protein